MKELCSYCHMPSDILFGSQEGPTICSTCITTLNPLAEKIIEEEGRLHDDLMDSEYDVEVDLEMEESDFKEFVPAKIPTPAELKAELDEYVVGQEKAKRVLSVAVHNHYIRIANPELELQKSNVLMVGPTGSGKTLLVKTLAKAIAAPCITFDVTSLSETGYVGGDVDDIIIRLFEEAGEDPDLTEMGIVYLDEIDKISKKSNETGRDVSGEGVQHGLLKMMEGVTITLRRKDSKREVTIDTSNILFICSGAFSGLDKIVDRRLNRSSIGFGAEVKASGDVTDGSLIDMIRAQDVIDYGMAPEFIGRLPILVTLAKLTTDDLIRIMYEPKDSLVKQYQALFATHKCDLTIQHAAAVEIAKLAVSRGTGARGLRSMLEDYLLDAMYEVPSLTVSSKATLKANNITSNTKMKLAVKAGAVQ